MKVGISITSSHRLDDVRDGARFMIERARAANDAGLDSLFVGDHHSTPQPYYQNTPILARLLAEWGDRTAGALYLLPLWHPVLLAEQIGTLAAMHDGRFVMQCAIGGDARQSRAMGVDPRKRVPMFAEALAIMRALWAGEEVTRDGAFPIEAARVAPLPPEPIEVWIGASADPAIDRAAELGDVWLASPGLDPAAAREQLSFYRQACGAHGRSPETVAIRRDVHVGEHDAASRRHVAPYIERGYRGFGADALVFGGVAAVVDQFATLAEMGYTDVLVRNITTDQAQALATIERLHEVAEAVRHL